MAASACAHVLLETVALVPHEDCQFIEAWGWIAFGNHYGCQQQKLLASGANACHAAGDVERMAEGTRTDQHKGPVDESAGL